MKSLVDVEDRLHRIISGGQIIQRLKWVPKGAGIHSRCPVGLPRVHINTEHLLRVDFFGNREARLPCRIFGNDQKYAAVHWGRREILGERNLKNKRRGRSGENGRGGKQKEGKQADAALHLRFSSKFVRLRDSRRGLYTRSMEM